MFPLSFPLGVLRDRARDGDRVLDPFCGRGTSNMAARVCGLWSVGIDSSPVAAAITAAKLVNVDPARVAALARSILCERQDVEVPTGEFWELAYDPSTLRAIAAVRSALLEECSAPESVALRALMLGALHGPLTKGPPSYLSNQAPRTYAPKPAYAVKFWRRRELNPPSVDLVDVIQRRAIRYYSNDLPASGAARLADSRDPAAFAGLESGFRWVITSPPYYGMRTYIPDQWLRYWFVGGPPSVEYGVAGQLTHSSPAAFADDLRAVWRNAAAVAEKGATLVIRFGGIADRSADPTEVLLSSLSDTGWQVQTVTDGGTAGAGKRQADSFLRHPTRSLGEIDVWAALA